MDNEQIKKLFDELNFRLSVVENKLLSATIQQANSKPHEKVENRIKQMDQTGDPILKTQGA